MGDTRIQILPESVINKIAAGEVVERPASVVKELIENALDAGSSEINIELNNGGKALIRVADNGCGMVQEDAILALERHATSKIREIEDLTRIESLGFRGEALPSIASVSQMVLLTQTREQKEGTRIVIEGGNIKQVSTEARSPGTTIEVRNLFFNLPVRKKFLKSTDTELRHIVQKVIEYAVAYPTTAFKLIHNGKSLYQLYSVSEQLERIRNIFGNQLTSKLIPFKIENGPLKIWGYLGPPELARTSSRHQLIYVNKRIINSRLIIHAITEGYHTLVPRGQYPWIILFLQLAPHLVDVNVHPTKREVRFSNEHWIHQQIVQAIEKTLTQSNLIPQISLGDQEEVVKPGKEQEYQQRIKSSVESYLQKELRESSDSQTTLPGFKSRKVTEGLHVRQTKVATDEQEKREELEHFWQLHDSYIFAQIKGGVLIIDQHAAHERILYEEVMASFAGQRSTAQQLLFPVTLELSPADYLLLQDILPLLNQIGFSIRCFGGNTVVVDAIPTSVKNWEQGKMLQALLDEMASYGKLSSGLKERLAVTYACKAAVKAGDPLKPAEMEFLISRLFATENPYTCPHGRPAVIKITTDELARKFGR